MSEIIIRRAKPDDWQEFLKMSKEFYSSPAVLNDIDEGYHKNAFDEAMRSDDYLVLYIFDADGEAAGFSMLNKMFSHETGGLIVWIEELYVREKFRGHGLGSRLLEFVEQTHPAMRYRLETEPENERANKLYKRHGYQSLGYTQLFKDMDRLKTN